MKKVLITSNSFGKYCSDGTELLKNNGFELIYNKYKRQMTEEELIEELSDCVAVILSTEVINKNVIDSCPDLKAISRYGVGSENIDMKYCEEKGIKVAFARNANSNAVAEYTISLILSCMKKVCDVNNCAKQNKWKKETGIDLERKTLGVVGLGSIGKQVIRLLSGFNLNVLAYDTYYDQEFVDLYSVKKVDLDTLLQESDVITLHLPPSNTDPLISRREFDLMKMDAVLINTARASLMDYTSLKLCLKSGKLFGVGIDVHENEPYFDQDLVKLGNVILTPHNAALSKEAIDKTSLITSQNLIELLD